MTDTMTDAQVDTLVLTVLAGQSADYLIHPDAAAFVALEHEQGVEFGADVIAASLARLDAAGHAREDEIVAMRYATDPVMETQRDANDTPVLDAKGTPVMVQAKNADGSPRTTARVDGNGDPVLEPMLDANGAEVTLAAGWCITDAGRAALPAA